MGKILVQHTYNGKQQKIDNRYQIFLTQVAIFTYIVCKKYTIGHSWLISFVPHLYTIPT